MAVPTNVRSFYNSSHVSDYFGDRPEWDFHHGVDFAHGAGTPVPALRSGTVALRDTHPDLGNYVVVQSGPNDYNGYCHLRGVPLELGQSVTQGKLLGTSPGTTISTAAPGTALTCTSPGKPYATRTLGTRTARTPGHSCSQYSMAVARDHPAAFHSPPNRAKPSNGSPKRMAIADQSTAIRA